MGLPTFSRRTRHFQLKEPTVMIRQLQSGWPWPANQMMAAGRFADSLPLLVLILPKGPPSTCHISNVTGQETEAQGKVNDSPMDPTPGKFQEIRVKVSGSKVYSLHDAFSSKIPFLTITWTEFTHSESCCTKKHARNKRNRKTRVCVCVKARINFTFLEAVLVMQNKNSKQIPVL